MSWDHVLICCALSFVLGAALVRFRYEMMFRKFIADIKPDRQKYSWTSKL